MTQIATDAIETKKPRQIDWYRTPLTREQLKELSQRSDFLGFVQTLGYLIPLALTLTAAIYGYGRWHWSIIVGIVFLHGMIGSFLINGVHELGHGTVFRTKWLNELFVRILSFFHWINFQHFGASHTRHHAFTLHPPDDLEVVLPIRVLVWNCLKHGIVNHHTIRWAIGGTIATARGKLDGEWNATLFPPSAPHRAEPTIRWARTLLIGHSLVLIAALSLGWFVSPRWLLLIPMVTLLVCYGGWLQWLCNNTQHVGLCDNVPDYRLNCRTFLLNPVVQFFYWHMNYHIEHHMYPTVPCYRLGQLHRAIEHDLAPCPRGLVATWREIIDIMEKQQADPTYQHHNPVPSPRLGNAKTASKTATLSDVTQATPA
jgi:fatty acid desaturase